MLYQNRQRMEVASQTLRDGGYLLASDYFHFKKDRFSKWHTRASHDEKNILKALQIMDSIN